jgi:dienelactone hydrolase
MTSFRHICAILALVWLTVAHAMPAAPPLAVYGRLPDFETARLSPSGKRVAMVGLFGTGRRLRVIEDGKEILSWPVGTQKVRDLHWAGEDRLLLLVSDTEVLGPGFTAARAELARMLVVPISGGDPWPVFGGLSSVSGNVRGYYGAVERDGRWYGYFGGTTLELDRFRLPGPVSTRPELYEVDLASRGSRRIGHRPDDPTRIRDWAIGADGRIVATLDIRTGSGAWEIRADGGAVIARGVLPSGDVGLLGLGRTPGTILYSLGDDEARRQLFEQPIAGGPPVELLAGAPVGAYLFDNRSFLFLGHVEDGDMPAERFFDRRFETAMTAARNAFPGVSVRLGDASETFDRLVVETSGPGDPDSWWLFDATTGRKERLGQGYPIDPADVGPMRMLRFTAADGLEMAGVLTLPPGRSPNNLPLVMLPHGGPPARDYPVFDWWAQAFAARGYAVFQPNFRGSTGLGPAFRRAGWGEWGRKMQSDISDGLAELARQGIVDPRRACIVGGSYGGYAALAGVTLQQGLYRCAVSVAGIGDIPRMLRDTVRESGDDRSLDRAMKREVSAGRDMQLVSPASFADRADAPILLIHGEDDTVVPFAQSRTMANALKRAGKPVEFVTLEGEDHWLSKSETRLKMLEAAVAFVEKHNPAGPAPAVQAQ